METEGQETGANQVPFKNNLIYQEGDGELSATARVLTMD